MYQRSFDNYRCTSKAKKNNSAVACKGATAKNNKAIGAECSNGVIYGGANIEKKVKAYSNMQYIVKIGW